MVADEDPQEILLLSHFATTWIYFMRATSRQRKILPDSLFKITNLLDNFFVLSEELSHHLGHSVDIFLRHLECPEIFQSSRNLTINIRQTVDSEAQTVISSSSEGFSGDFKGSWHGAKLSFLA